MVVQGSDAGISELAGEFHGLPVRVVPCPGRGVGRARNLGFREVRFASVAVTDDDCTVAPDWIGTARRLVAQDPLAIYTGQVMAAGDPVMTPATITDPTPRDFTGAVRCDRLYPNNMVCNASEVLAFGGFDTRFGPELPAEDGDFGYRWLRAGRGLRYEPSLRVWHHDWRSRDQLRELYRRYGRGQGAFYAKHLRTGDFAMLRFLFGDLYGATRTLASSVRRHQPELALAPLSILRGLPEGLRQGWRKFVPAGRHPRGRT